MPRYSRRKCAASNRAETRTVNRESGVGCRVSESAEGSSDSRPPIRDPPKTRVIISSLMPNSRNSSGVDCERSRSSARASSQQSAGLEPSASSISVCNVLRRSASFLGSTAGSVQCAPPDNAPAEKHPLQLLQEDLSRRLEALPLLRFRRVPGASGRTDPEVHAAQGSGIRATDGQEG
jgi:hypothetical protein